MPNGIEDNLQAVMYQLTLDEADQEYEEIQNEPPVEIIRSESRPLGIVQLFLQREGPWFRRYVIRDQVALARYVWFSMNRAEQDRVRRRSTRHPERAGWEFPWTMTLPRRLSCSSGCFTFCAPNAEAVR